MAIFRISSLPSHEHVIMFPCIQILICFSNVWVSGQGLCPFVNWIPNTPFGVIVNGTFPCAVLDCFHYWYIETQLIVVRWSCVPTPCPLWSRYLWMNTILILPFQSDCLLFSLLFALETTSSIMSRWCSKRRYICLVPNLRRKASIFHYWVWYFRFFIGAFHYVEKFLFYF